MKIVTVLFKYDYGVEDRGESLEKSVFFPALCSLGYEVYPFWLEENGYDYDLVNLQQKIISFCEDKKPDTVFFIMMRDEVTSRTLNLLKSRYITLNWFCDDQWRFESYSHRMCLNFTYSVTVDKYSIHKYKHLGYDNIIHSQWASNNYRDDYEPGKTEYKYEISFVGGKNLTREWIIYELSRSGFDIKCFGAGWNNGRVSFSEMEDIFYNSKINLNLSNSVPNDYRFRTFVRNRILKNYLNPFLFLKSPWSIRKLFRDLKLFINPFSGQKKIEQIKARHFEIPGCCGFQIAQYALEVEDFYNIGNEIVVYSSIDELIRLLDFYLINNKERERIKYLGYLKTKNYTYVSRLKDVFSTISHENGA